MGGIIDTPPCTIFVLLQYFLTWQADYAGKNGKLVFSGNGYDLTYNHDNYNLPTFGDDL